MELSPAPLFEDVAGGPAGGAAHWLHTTDEKRIRVGHWLPEGEANGTVFMFPGRTEYIEKYGSTAGRIRYVADLLCPGCRLARTGPGRPFAGRPTRIGHVDKFTDYQHDVQTVLDLATLLDLPQPWYVIGHSMGGAIGLRAVIEKKCFAACAFTGPMWGIYFSPIMKPLSRVTAYWGTALGMGRMDPTDNLLGKLCAVATVRGQRADP